MAAVMPAAPAMTFAIRPLVSAGAAGSVTVMLTGNTARYHVVVASLAPGSVHAIHDHLGVCGAANRSGHLSVLDVTRANRFGVITFDSTVSRAEAGAGRIVIVYATASPAVIIGCAAL